MSESLKWISLAFQKTRPAVHQSLVKQSHAHCCYCQPAPLGLAVGEMCSDYNLGTDMVKCVTELGQKGQTAVITFTDTKTSFCQMAEEEVTLLIKSCNTIQNHCMHKQ